MQRRRKNTITKSTSSGDVLHDIIGVYVEELSVGFLRALSLGFLSANSGLGMIQTWVQGCNTPEIIQLVLNLWDLTYIYIYIYIFSA